MIYVFLLQKHLLGKSSSTNWGLPYSLLSLQCAGGHPPGPSKVQDGNNPT